MEINKCHVPITGLMAALSHTIPDRVNSRITTTIGSGDCGEYILVVSDVHRNTLNKKAGMLRASNGSNTVNNVRVILPKIG